MQIKKFVYLCTNINQKQINMSQTEVEVLKTKNNDYYNVDPRNIIIDEEFNVRKDYGNIEALALSIVNNGQVEPIIACKVRGEDKFKLVDGFRRMRAINWAIEKGYEIPFVKVMLSVGNEEDRIFAMVITGIDKKLLNPLEEGEAYKRLINFGYKPKEIATRVGKTVAHIYNVLKLADAPKIVKDAITENAITATTVTQIIREVKNSNELIDVVTNAIKEAKTNVNGKKAKATIKDANINKLKTPIQKLCEAHELVTKKGETELSEKLYHLINLLKDKTSTAKDISKLFS